MTDLGDCPLCGRKLVTGSSVNQHHLVPRSRNGRDTIALHRICHAAIHAARSEKEQRVRLLIIDDWEPEPLNAEQRRDLLEIVEDRYDRGSLLITSQGP